MPHLPVFGADRSRPAVLSFGHLSLRPFMPVKEDKDGLLVLRSALSLAGPHDMQDRAAVLGHMTDAVLTTPDAETGMCHLGAFHIPTSVHLSNVR